MRISLPRVDGLAAGEKACLSPSELLNLISGRGLRVMCRSTNGLDMKHFGVLLARSCGLMRFQDPEEVAGFDRDMLAAVPHGGKWADGVGHLNELDGE